MGVGLLLGSEDLPSTAQQLEGALGHRGLVEREVVARQDGVGRQQRADGGLTALEVDVYVHDMLLADCLVGLSRLVALAVLVPVDDGDNLVAREVVDAGLAHGVERALLRGHHAIDGEARELIAMLVHVGMLVLQALIFGFRDNLALLAGYAFDSGSKSKVLGTIEVAACVVAS